MGEARIVSVWKANGIKKAVGLKRAKLLYLKASKSIGLIASVIAAKQELAMCLEQYILLNRQLDELMGHVERLGEQIPGSKEMMTILCIGLKVVAGFLAEVGDLSGYEHSRQIVRHAGLSLRENSSGMHKGETTINKRGRRLRALLYQGALILVGKNMEFKALHKYFTTRQNNPLKKICQ